MSVAGDSLRDLAALVEGYDFGGGSGLSSDMDADARTIALLVAARRNDRFWRELGEWARKTGGEVDLETLRARLPERPEGSPAAILESLGVGQGEASAILEGIAAQARREAMVREAFASDDPARTAKALEEVVETEYAPSAVFLKKVLVASARAVALGTIVGAIILLGLRGCVQSTTLYKGVSP